MQLIQSSSFRFSCQAGNSQSNSEGNPHATNCPQPPAASFTASESSEVISLPSRPAAFSQVSLCADTVMLCASLLLVLQPGVTAHDGMPPNPPCQDMRLPLGRQPIIEIMKTQPLEVDVNLGYESRQTYSAV